MPVNTVTTGEIASDEWANDVANSVNLLESDVDALENGVDSIDIRLDAVEIELSNATSAATANRLMERDANGRAKVAAPSATTDIANKTYVDGLTQRIGARRSRG